MSPVEFGRPIEILLVEDSSSDARLTLEALREGRISNTMHHVRDGEAAIEFLRREGQYADAPRPDLILLDLNLPRMDGREVLREVKCDGDLRIIPILVLTSSKDEKDVLQAYGLNANCYITKPLDIDDFLNQMRLLSQFWFAIARLPTQQ